MKMAQRVLSGIDRANKFLDRHEPWARLGEVVILMGALVVATSMIATKQPTTSEIKPRSPAVAFRVQEPLTDAEAQQLERLSSSLRKLVVSVDKLETARKEVLTTAERCCGFKLAPEGIVR